MAKRANLYTCVVILLLGIVGESSGRIPTPVLWYNFDEKEPNTVAHDSSWRQLHGQVEGPNDGWDPNGGRLDGCRIFDNDTAVIAPNEVLSDIYGGVTIGVWLKDAWRQDSDNWVFDTGSGDYRVQAAVVTQPEQEVLWRAGNDTNDVLTWDLDGIDPCTLEGWHLWFFVKNEEEDEISIYFDSCLAASNDVVDDTLVNVQNTPFKIGALTSHAHDFVGKMDEFGVYNHALSYCDICGCPLCAWGPRPYWGQVDVPPDVVLTWHPGGYAVQYDVYFGTDFDDVNNATDPNTLPGRGRQDANSYDPGGLDLNTIYYWRIDEVNDAIVLTCKGTVWWFTVANFLVVDDMESYSTEEPNRIYDTWHDWEHYDPVGGEYPTAAQLTIETEDANVHGGERSMKFQYNNSDEAGWYFYRDISEIDANTIGPQSLDTGKDWTILDMKVLTLHFLGHPDNDANEQMYVALADSASRTAVVPYGYYDDEDMNDIKKQEWTEWNILLEDFNDINDVNVADVNNVYIGFGNRDNPVPGGSGVVFFDDIRLYPPRCIPDRGPVADFSGNCIVELEDFAILGNQWLQPPGSPSADICPEPPDGIVNMLDLDCLTESWLEEKLWP